jgi:hypothetical protein
VKIALENVTAVSQVMEPCGGISAGPNALEFQGSGSFNGSAATFRVCVEDNGERANPDRFYLACLSGCAYDTAARAPDNGLSGGNIKVQQPATAAGTPSADESSQGHSAAVLMLDSLLLSEGLAGQTQLLQVRVYDAQGELLSGEHITLVRTNASGAVVDSFTAVAADGLVLFTVTTLLGESEFIAYAGDLSSNGINVKGLSLLP